MKLTEQVNKFLLSENYQYILDPVRLSKKYHRWPAPMLHELGVTVRHEAANENPDSNTILIPKSYAEPRATEPIAAIRGYYTEPIKRYNYLGVCLSLFIHGFLHNRTESFDFVTLSNIEFLTDKEIGSILYWAELFLGMQLKGRTKRNDRALRAFRKEFARTQTFAFSHSHFFLTTEQKQRLLNNNRPMVPKLIAEDNTWDYVPTDNMSNRNLIDEGVFDPEEWSNTYNAQVFLASSLNNFNQVTYSKEQDAVGYFDGIKNYGYSGGSFEFDTAYMLNAVNLGLHVVTKQRNINVEQLTLIHHQILYEKMIDPDAILNEEQELIGAAIDWSVRFLKNTCVSLLPRTLKPLYNKWLISQSMI
jgi:hypothetical protein